MLFRSDAFRVHRDVSAQGRLPVATIPVFAPLANEKLPAEVSGKVEYDTASKTLHVREPLTRGEAVALRDALPTLTDRAAVEQYWQTERGVGTAAKALDEYAQPVRVPQLIIRDGKRSYLFEPEELDEFSWDLDNCDAALTEAEFSVELNVGDSVSVGVTDRGGLRIGGVEEVIVRQLSFLAEEDDWTKLELVRWLDDEVHHGGALAGLPKAQSQAWLVRVVNSLLADRKADLPILVRKRHELADAAIRRISAHGRKQVRAAANLLIAGQSPRQLETSMDRPVVLSEQDYGPYRLYRGVFGSLKKHAFTLIADMDNDDEAECAKLINEHPNVKRWVRNLAHESAGGFSLPLSPGRFFPDFIVELNDGRMALVEYKNAKLAKAEPHKKDVGDLWAARSSGTCVFAWVVERDWATLKAAIGKTQT